MSIFSGTKKCIPLALLILTFFLLPVTMLAGLEKMPGDIGDARLNNYFLENIFQYLCGRTDSLWHLPFYSPFPYVLGFSDNLFGSAPVYLLARFIGAGADTSFQVWFLFGYVANFFAAYYALRRLNGSVVAASIGALIFAFALPTTAHAGHAQLHYRFGVPLALAFFTEFLTSKSWRSFSISGAWTVWQLYAGVYIGFFTLLLIASMGLTHFLYRYLIDKISAKSALNEFINSWRAQLTRQKIILSAEIVVLILLLLLLFYPYIQVSRLYGAKRSWDEISLMLPRPASYFLADASFLWSNSGAKAFLSLGMRHEHQMFVGLVPLLLALAGFFIGSNAKNGVTFTLMSGMLGVAVALTLCVGGFSLWYLLYKFPFASAIRAMTRIDQAFLFPVAYLSAVAIDAFRIRMKLLWGAISILLVVLFVTEARMTTMYTSTKESWAQRMSTLDASTPPNLPKNSILFFAQRSGPPFADELDAMWVSLKHMTLTMNGYSGLNPPDYQYVYGTDCTVIPRRITSYLKFIGESGNLNLYRELMSRIVPVGFFGCNQSWLQSPPNISDTDRVYTKSEFSRLNFSSAEIINTGNQRVVRVEISNPTDNNFSANSSVGAPIRLSWRLVGANGRPFSGWDARKDLPFDIPAKGKLEVSIPLDFPINPDAKAIEVSIVLEGYFWGHDVGVQPRNIALPVSTNH